MRVLAFMMASLFVYCSSLQLNDPDPLVWICAYAFPALVSLLVVMKRSVFWMALLGSVFYIGWALYWVPPLDTSFMDNEEAREAAGLAISGLWMGALAAGGWVQRNTAQVRVKA